MMVKCMRCGYLEFNNGTYDQAYSLLDEHYKTQMHRSMDRLHYRRQFKSIFKALWYNFRKGYLVSSR